MSTMSEILGDGSWMLPLSEVTHVRWNYEKAKLFRELLEQQATKFDKKKISARWLSERLTEIGYEFSYQYIYDVRNARPSHVSIDLLIGVCKFFDINLSYFVPGIYVKL